MTTLTTLIVIVIVIVAGASMPELAVIASAITIMAGGACATPP